MIVLGKNTDLALLKKQGQGGTIAVGSGTPFKIQRANTAAVAVSSTMEDIFVIGVDKQTTLPGALAAGGNIDNTSKGKVLTQAIELSMSTPYIDFYYNNSTADYTARLIHDRQNRLNAQVQSFWVTDGRITASSTMPANPATGTQLTSNPVRSLMAGRGAYGDVDGAYVQMYMEEQVGAEHRLVLYADGFGRTDAWIFRAGGTISTGKGDVMTTGSDVRLKEGFTEAPQNALQRVEKLGVCEYQMKGENRRRRGFIAQQADTVDTTYTFMGCEQENDGEKFRVMNVDYVAIIADLVLSVQELRKQIADLIQINRPQ
ncbi:tail fiber domain-containing protein [Klebsiella quasipneumoniae]|nr:tail fiber domain-containing protein [Klebsiella quasipneumoniae]